MVRPSPIPNPRRAAGSSGAGGGKEPVAGRTRSPVVPRGLAFVVVLAASLAVGPSPVDGTVSGSLSFLPQVAEVAQVADSSFRHDRHEAFECLDCHSMDGGHGALRVQDVGDCRACHHVPERVERACEDCHEAEELGPMVFSGTRIFDLSVQPSAVTRSVDFTHRPHEARPCRECHVGGPTLAAPDLDCGSCHEEHHVETSSACMTCHRPAPEGAHTLTVHETCSGSGCHVDPPFAASPPTRVGCMWCHDDKADHEVGTSCVECHLQSTGSAPPPAASGSPQPRTP